MIESKRSQYSHNFPKLMINYNDKSSFVVMMTKEGTRYHGQVLDSTSDNFKVGYFSDTWLIDNFSDYHGHIDLINK